MTPTPSLDLLNDDERAVLRHLTAAMNAGCTPTPYTLSKACHRQIRFVLQALDRLAAFGFIELPARGYDAIHLKPEPRPCPCCGEPMRVYAVNHDKPDLLSAECHTVGCALTFVTLPLGAHERLTEQQVAGYARARARVSNQSWVKVLR